MKKALFASIAVVGLVALGATSSAFAAQTRTLPAGETLYAIDCHDDIGQLVSVDPTSAEMTFIGNGTDSSNANCAADAAWDPNTNTAYWVAWYGNETLFATDVATGDSTEIGDLTDSANEVNLTDIYGLFMGTDGVLYGLAPTDINGVQLFTVDLSTAEITFVAPLNIDGQAWEGASIWSTSYNPADGKFYFIEDADGLKNLYSLDLQSGEATLVTAAGDDGGNPLYGLAFDSAGTMWSTGAYSAEFEDYNHVASATLDSYGVDGGIEFSDGQMMFEDSTWYSESNFITYAYTAPSASSTPTAAALASTGVAFNGAAGAVLALVAAGAVLLVVRKRHAG